MPVRPAPGIKERGTGPGTGESPVVRPPTGHGVGERGAGEDDGRGLADGRAAARRAPG
ncbi:hypothetical protein GCM10009550_38080 [Actinocorallia libanotica]|uniref:Uncharacterized protein n=1 Tax=Actinocorallia libanotica TaxID=46162 RepID=A0ABP4BTI6_9ACTN